MLAYLRCAGAGWEAALVCRVGAADFRRLALSSSAGSPSLDSSPVLSSSLHSPLVSSSALLSSSEAPSGGGSPEPSSASPSLTADLISSFSSSESLGLSSSDAAPSLASLTADFTISFSSSVPMLMDLPAEGPVALFSRRICTSSVVCFCCL